MLYYYTFSVTIKVIIFDNIMATFVLPKPGVEFWYHFKLYHFSYYYQIICSLKDNPPLGHTHLRKLLSNPVILYWYIFFWNLFCLFCYLILSDLKWGFMGTLKGNVIFFEIMHLNLLLFLQVSVTFSPL